MTKQEMLGEIQELLKNQHHNIYIKEDCVWVDKIKKKGYTEDEVNEIDENFRMELIEDFAEFVVDKLGFDVVQLGRGGASLCVDAYEHSGDGYHYLNKTYGRYENGTGQHIKNDLDEDWSYGSVLIVYRSLKRYKKEIGKMMERYYKGTGLKKMLLMEKCYKEEGNA